MKKITLAIMAVVYSIANMHAQEYYNLANGTMINVNIINEISSQQDGIVSIQVANDVVDNKGMVVIRSGSPVQCTIDRTKRKGVGKPGKVAVSITSVKAIDGQEIRLSGSYSKTGKNKKAMVLGVGLGVGLLTPLWPMLAFLAKKGDAAIIPGNTFVPNVIIMGNYIVQ
jgi:hypothetical protein